MLLDSLFKEIVLLNKTLQPLQKKFGSFDLYTLKVFTLLFAELPQFVLAKTIITPFLHAGLHPDTHTDTFK